MVFYAVILRRYLSCIFFARHLQNSTVWYHQGPEGLSEARMWLADFSLNRAKIRLDLAKEFYATVSEPQRKAKLQEYFKTLRVS